MNDPIINLLREQIQESLDKGFIHYTEDGQLLPTVDDIVDRVMRQEGVMAIPPAESLAELPEAQPVKADRLDFAINMAASAIIEDRYLYCSPRGTHNIH